MRQSNVPIQTFVRLMPVTPDSRIPLTIVITNLLSAVVRAVVGNN